MNINARYYSLTLFFWTFSSFEMCTALCFRFALQIFRRVLTNYFEDIIERKIRKCNVSRGHSVNDTYMHTHTNKHTHSQFSGRTVRSSFHLQPTEPHSFTPLVQLSRLSHPQCSLVNKPLAPS